MLTFPQAIQAIAALEARAADFEGRLAAGTAKVDECEFAVVDSLAAAATLRHQHGITVTDPELQALHDLFDRTIADYRTERMQDAAWELHKAEFDRLQAADPEAPVWGGIEQYQAEGR